MSEFLWPIVALVFLGIANYRLGQYLVPPFQKKVEEIENKFGAQERVILELKSKVNALMVDRGFSK